MITDPFNSGDNQTCKYAHDDLVRLASAGCGSIWSQTFTYDPFSNIVASGSSSFQATYSSTTNRMTQIGSSTPTYDLNGNVTNDFLNTYSWDSNARPTVIDGIAVTYDALGRIAEEDKSGTYTQFVYSPTGQEFALMNGQTLSKAYIPLPAGEVAAYNSSGLNNYHHMDWLGNFRLSSSTTRTVLYDAAYAPFGVTYAQTGTGTAAFTGMTSDTAATVYDFPAREYGYQGRWPSPDPAGMAAVDPTNPQSWNRYAYVFNNPLAYIDPSGMRECAPNNSGGQSNSPSCFHGASDTSMSGDFPVTGVNGIVGGLTNWAEFGYSYGLSVYTIDVSLGVFTTMPGSFSIGGGGGGNTSGSWWGTFAKEFFKFSGGPGNVPTCAGQALRDIADDVLNPVPTDFGPAEAGKLAATYGAAVQFNRTLAYAAGKGLTSPWKSTVFQGMLEGSKSLAEETGVGSIAVATSFSAAYRTYTTSAAARNGQCSAAFPIF